LEICAGCGDDTELRAAASLYVDLEVEMSLNRWKKSPLVVMRYHLASVYIRLGVNDDGVFQSSHFEKHAQRTD